MRTQLLRVATVSWRLSGAARGICPTDATRTGLLIDYIGAYADADRALVTASLGMSDLPQIAGVVPGSAAQAAGLREGDDIVAINGIPALSITAPTGDAEAARPALLADAIEEYMAARPAGDAIALTIHREGREERVVMRPDRGCSPRVVVHTSQGVTAYSDSQNVALGMGLVTFTRSDDELALVAGHELVHVINRDPLTKNRSQREKEKRADVVGAALARCAGYDIETALQFWTRYKSRDWLNFIKIGAHGSIKSRVALIRTHAGSTPCPPDPDFFAPQQ